MKGFWGMKLLLRGDGQEVALAKRDSAVGTSTMESSVEIIDKLTPIQKFYDGESVFLTSGTGFIEKLWIEKLLRGCPGIRCIYVLIFIKKKKKTSFNEWKKKGKNVLRYMEELMEDSVSCLLFLYFLWFSFNYEILCVR